MVDRLSQLHHRGEAGPLQSLAAHDTEPAFDLVEPRGMSGGVMKMNVGMTCPPAIMLGLMGIQVVYDHVQVQIRIGSHQTVHKVQELAPAAALQLNAVLAQHGPNLVRTHIPQGLGQEPSVPATPARWRGSIQLGQNTTFGPGRVAPGRPRSRGIAQPGQPLLAKTAPPLQRRGTADAQARRDLPGTQPGCCQLNNLNAGQYPSFGLSGAPPALQLSALALGQRNSNSLSWHGATISQVN